MNSQEDELEEFDNLIWCAIAVRQDIVSGRKIAMQQQISTVRQDSDSRFSDDFPILQYLDQALSLARNFRFGRN